MVARFDQAISRLGQRLVLLAPATSLLAQFQNVIEGHDRHADYLHQMQRFRGDVYSKAGHLRNSDLLADGRDDDPVDDLSWHVLTYDSQQRINGCSRYRLHENIIGFEDLCVSQSALAGNDTWRRILVRAVEEEIDTAQRAGLRYAEFGGWALRADRRHTTDCLLQILATVALGRLLGNAVGIATANLAHTSAATLSRFGCPLEHEGTRLPEYFEPRYNADIQIMTFHSSRLQSRYALAIEAVAQQLTSTPVFRSRRASSSALHVGVVS